MKILAGIIFSVLTIAYGLAMTDSFMTNHHFPVWTFYLFIFIVILYAVMPHS